jgi:O-antigen/teichoic acid export membrane protein
LFEESVLTAQSGEPRHGTNHDGDLALSVSRHTAYNLVGQILPILLGLVTVPLYLKLVGSERYGVLAIAWLLLGYFGMFDLGLGRATSFRLAAQKGAEPQSRADTMWAALAVNGLMGVTGGLILWGVAAIFFGHLFKVGPDLRPEVLASVPLLALTVPVATVTGVLTGAMQGRERFLEINTVNVISTTLLQLIPLGIAATLGPHLPLLLAGTLMARGLAAAVLAYRCHAELTRGMKMRIERGEIVSLLKYGGWVNLTSIFGPVLYMLDRFTIGAMLSATAVTDYTVPYTMASRTAIMSGSLLGALFPRLSSASADEREVLADRATMTILALLSPLFLAGIYIMQPFLHFWVGQRVGPDAPFVGRFILLGMWANALALVPFTRLQASGRPDLVSKILIAEIPPYLLMLWAGIHFFGLVGCAAAAAFRYLMDYMLLTRFAGRRFTGGGLTLATFVVLGAAVYCAGVWGFTDPRWWVSGAALGAISLLLGARALPDDLRTRFTGVLRRGSALS